LPVVDKPAVVAVVLDQVVGVLEQVVEFAAGVLHLGDPAIELRQPSVCDLHDVAAPQPSASGQPSGRPPVSAMYAATSRSGSLRCCEIRVRASNAMSAVM
jgi:hypothetical protein